MWARKLAWTEFSRLVTTWMGRDDRTAGDSSEKPCRVNSHHGLDPSWGEDTSEHLGQCKAQV